MQRRVGLQAAGGQAAATDEEALPYRGQSLSPAALPTGGLHLHPQTQVQRGLQEACALETLVPVERRDSPLLLLMHRIHAPVGTFVSFSFTPPFAATWLFDELEINGHLNVWDKQDIIKKKHKKL